MKNKQIVFFWLLRISVLVIPFSSFLSARLIILLLIYSLFFGKHKSIAGLGAISWDIFFYLFLLLVGLCYSENIKDGWRVLETNFCFLAFPLIFSRIPPLDEKRLIEILYWFISGLLLTCIVCLINATNLYFENRDVHVFFFYQLTDIVHSHPTYLAYYLICAITVGIYLLFYQRSSVNKFVIVAMLSFFFLILMLTGGQTTFVSMLFVFSFFILKFLIEERPVIRYVIVGLVCAMMLCMFLINSIEQENRNFILNDSWERFVLWEAAIKAIPDIIWGVGTGDYKNVLNDYYLSHGLKQFAGDSYNSHNQFIQILLTNGIFGVISVLLLICRPLYLAVKNQHVLGVLVFFPFLIYGTTEVFLGRYQGVVFFALLHHVFISYYSSLKPSLMSLKGV